MQLPMNVACDNQVAIQIASNPVFMRVLSTLKSIVILFRKSRMVV